MKKLFKASTILALMSPFAALAAVPVSVTPVNASDPNIAYNPVGTGVPDAGDDRISRLLSLVSYWLVVIATIVIAIGLITFLWGVVQYITAGADEEKRGAARNMMIYGIIGLFVMVSVWGLVYFVGSLVGIEPGGGVNLPGVPAVLNTTTSVS
jgi:hypothetical protein